MNIKDWADVVTLKKEEVKEIIWKSYLSGFAGGLVFVGILLTIHAVVMNW